ncbi:Neutral ceramidase, partial [Tetrabaena socialis]
MGYAAPLQTAQGLHTRLFARAFMFAERTDPRRRFVYVSMDACMASQLVTLRVIQRLQAEYGAELYGPENVAISGTHTHASPAGFIQYLLYDITSLGFVPATFDAMVEGVLTAIRAAHASLRPAALALASGDLQGASINRSPTAYLANPQEERDMYETDVDTDLSLLRVNDASTGAGLGALGWFAVHCTSLNNTNRLVSGDNKGAAQLLLERWAAEAEAMAAAQSTSKSVGAPGEGSQAEAIAAAAAAAAASAALGLDLRAVVAAEGGNGSGSRGGPFRIRIHSQPFSAASIARGPDGNGDGSNGSHAGGGSGGGGAGGLVRFGPGFVGALAQASVGDTSPNTQGAFCLDTGLPCDAATSTCNGRNELCHGRGPAWPDDRTSAAIIGARQFEAARLLYASSEQTHSTCAVRLCAGSCPCVGRNPCLTGCRLSDPSAPQLPLSGTLDFRSAYLDMAKITIDSNSTFRRGGPAGWKSPRASAGARTCPPAMGMSFAAGTTDGPGAFDFTQGDTKGRPLWRMLMSLVLPPSQEQQACQAPKPILLDTGQITISLLRLGQLVIACVPGELTTMAGRRLKMALRQRFSAAAARGSGPGPGSDVRVVISGLTGTYSSYITTWEEYQVQRYEGASTLYGPHTLDAYIQEFLRLADAMIDGRSVTSESRQVSLLAPVVLDWVPLGSHFGQVVEQARTSYLPGETVQVTFRAANPRNNLRTNGTFMAVEYMAVEPSPPSDPASMAAGDGANTAAAAAARAAVRDEPAAVPQGTGRRPSKLSPESYATLFWDVPRDAVSGIYRLKYNGDAKSLTGEIRAFEACSSPFS